MSNLVLHKRSSESGPFLKTVTGEELQMVGGQKWQTTDILDTDYVLGVGDEYLFDVQEDAPSQTLINEIGYPLQAAPLPGGFGWGYFGQADFGQ